MTDVSGKKSRPNMFSAAMQRKNVGADILSAGITPTAATERPTEAPGATSSEEIRPVDLTLMVPHDANTIYSLDGIQELSDNIALNGLLHPIVVRPLGDGTYRIISGHRRRLALLELISRPGGEKYRSPQTVVRHDISDEVDEEIALHMASADDRVMSDLEKAHRAKRLQELFQEKKKRGTAEKGHVRDLVGKIMGISGIQVQRYLEIADKLAPELQGLIDEGILGGSVALEFKNRSFDDQKAIAAMVRSAHGKGVEISREQAKDLSTQDVDDFNRLRRSFDELHTQLAQARKSADSARREKDRLARKLRSIESDPEASPAERTPVTNTVELSLVAKNAANVLEELSHQMKLASESRLTLNSRQYKDLQHIMVLMTDISAQYEKLK